jgi:hypothetical protein
VSAGSPSADEGFAKRLLLSMDKSGGYVNSPRRKVHEKEFYNKAPNVMAMLPWQGPDKAPDVMRAPSGYKHENRFLMLPLAAVARLDCPSACRHAGMPADGMGEAGQEPALPCRPPVAPPVSRRRVVQVDEEADG